MTSESQTRQVQQGQKLTVIRHRRLRKQHIALAGHSPSHRMDGKADIDALGPEHMRNLGERVLCLGHGHAVPDDLFLVSKQDVSIYICIERESLFCVCVCVCVALTMMTFSAFTRDSTTSSTAVSVTLPSIFLC